MKPISEEEARRILAEAKNLTTSPEEFLGERTERGWAFDWADQSEMWVGGHPYVVTDTGKVGMMRLEEKTPEETIERLEREQSP